MVENNRVQSRWAHQVGRIITFQLQIRNSGIFMSTLLRTRVLSKPCREPTIPTAVLLQSSSQRARSCEAKHPITREQSLQDRTLYVSTTLSGTFATELACLSTGITNCNHEEESIWSQHICSTLMHSPLLRKVKRKDVNKNFPQLFLSLCWEFHRVSTWQVMQNLSK